MPWIHVATATLLVLGTVALLAFLRAVESLADAESELGGASAPAGRAPSGTPARWPPPPAVAGHLSRAPRATEDTENTAWSHAA